MKTILNVAAAVGIFWLVCLGIHTADVKAQSAQAATFVGTAAHSTCLTPASGSYFLCVASDGVWVSNNGAAYFQLTAPSAAAAPSITINGTQKTLPASFTIAAAAPSVSANATATAPTVTAQ